MKRISLVALLFTLGFASAAVAGAPGTMRVDYFHGGNNTTEMFSLDQVVVEPLPWTGNMAQPLDKTSRGKYLFEIVDPESGNVAWSRSFSSIYGEWETTGESRQINRSFHESVRFPAQEATFELVIKKRGPGNEFVEVWRIKLDPTDVLVHHESAMYAEHVVAIHTSGDPATKVDLLLMGDGYTADRARQVHCEGQGTDRSPVRHVALQGAHGRLQRLGHRAAGRRVRRIPAVNGHLPGFTHRRDLRRVSFRALRADVR